MSLIRTALLASLALATACVVGDGLDRLGPGDSVPPGGDGSGGGSDGPSESIDSKLSNNGLDLRPVALDHLTTAALAIAEGDQLVFAEDNFPGLLDVVTTRPPMGQEQRSGLELLRYAALCALDDGEELFVASEDTSLPGHLGLAPQWAEGPCDDSCQRWVTACLLAHTNPTANSVTLSLRGENPGLVWSDEDMETFNYQEGAYYGNVFRPAGERQLLACAGSGAEDDMAGDQIGLQNYFSSRICAAGITCGFELTGMCRSDSGVAFASLRDESCEQLVGAHGYYHPCTERAEIDLSLGGGSPEPPASFEEVITVYLVQRM